jgi:ethanolamine-phosphate cytidylyltransferase
VGHVDFLEKVKACGDYLIVGLHSDRVIYQKKKYVFFNNKTIVLSVDC